MKLDTLSTKKTLRSILLRLVLLLVLLTGLIGWPRSIQASPTGTITVNTTTDELNNDGDCSLREAIQAANTNAAVDACSAGNNTDTITFDPATNGNPFILTGAANENGNASGDLDILNGGHLVIQGNGIANTIISGGGIDRVFHICPGGTCDGEITISGVTIRNGSVSFSGGGGIYNNGATVNLRNSQVGGAGGGNQATFGGGIANLDGSNLTIEASTVSANTALSAGGIYNRGTLTVQNGSLIGEPEAGNQATDGDGGGILNEAGSVTLDASSAISNTATHEGGGIWNQDTLMAQNGSTINGNQAGYAGGGIFSNAAATIDASSVSRNEALGDELSDSGGGGIFNDGGTLTVQSGSIIRQNRSGFGGGGIRSGDSGETIITASQISHNIADTECGGGILSGKGVLTITDSMIMSNQADSYGGGICIGRASTVSMTSVTVQANTTDFVGGGIGNLGILTFVDGSLNANHARAGGGIYNEISGTATLDASVIDANTAESGGGGIYNVGIFYVQNGCDIRGNIASEDGGGIKNSNFGSMMVEASTIRDNAADYGGAIYSAGGDEIYVSGSRILNNTANTQGGAVYHDSDSATATVVDSCIVGNSDTGFFNNSAMQQFATQNWWGASTGPNTPGADTVSGNVSTDPFRTEMPGFCYEKVYLPFVKR